MKLKQDNNRLRSLLIIASIIVIYIVAFFPAYRLFSKSVIVLSVVPILLISFKMTNWHGFWVGLAFAPINIVLLYFADRSSLQTLIDGTFLIFYVFFAIFGAGISYLGSSWKRMQNDLAAHIKAEQKLQESEERFRALTEITTDLTLIFDETGRYHYVSPSVFKLTGYQQEEVLGNPQHPFIHPKDLPLIRTIIFRSREKPGVTSPVFQFRGKHRDGRWLSFEGQVTNMLQIPSVKGLVFSGREITRRVMAQKALKRSEYRYRALFNQSYDAIILVNLDGTIMDANSKASELLGYETEELVGSKAEFLSSREEVEDTQDKLAKTLEGEEVPIYERKARRKDGTIFIAEVSLSLVKDPDGEPLFIQSVSRDITERKQTEEKLKHLASHDQLTNLPNRALFFDRLIHALRLAQRHERKLAILFLDLNEFKLVNDTFGHPKGDLLLQVIGQRLKNCVRQSDTISRIGGDEFAILLEEISEIEDSTALAQRILSALSEPYNLSGKKVLITGSIGISFYPEHAKDAQGLLSCADQAMYAAKRQGINKFAVYKDSLASK